MSARFTDLPDDTVGANPRVGLVPSRDQQLDILTKHPSFGAVERKAVQRRQRIGRDRRTSPLDNVTVVVVV